MRDSQDWPSSDPPPSYAASQGTPTLNPSPGYFPFVASERTAVIAALLNNHIKPQLHIHALSGLSSTTLVFVPSNVSDLQPSPVGNVKIDEGLVFPGEKIVDFPSAENLSLTRLRGEENRLEFWRQPKVIQEIDRTLRNWLENDGLKILAEELEDFAASSDFPYRIAPQREARPAELHTGAEWRYVEERLLREGEATLEVYIRDMCLRTENEMGLYETRAGRVLVVKVDIGSRL